MTDMLMPDSPCTLTVTPGTKGGMAVALHVPTYSGMATFDLSVERDGEGDWIVSIPWPDRDRHPEVADREVIVDDGYGVMNGLLYLGAPDVPVPNRPVKES